MPKWIIARTFEQNSETLTRYWAGGLKWKDEITEGVARGESEQEILQQYDHACRAYGKKWQGTVKVIENVPRPRCISGKNWYGTRPQAELVLLRLWRIGGPRRREKRAYLCGLCNLYHLTSRDDREQTELVETV